MFMKSFKSQRWLVTSVLAVASTVGALALSGCERKERVLDIEAPGVDVEVDRNIDTGEVEVETNRN